MSYRGIAWRPSFRERVNFEATTVMAIATAASAALSAANAIQQGEASRKAAGYQAALADNEAIAARQQAEAGERQQRETARRRLSAQRTRVARGGVLAEEGSPLFVNASAAEQAEIEALDIRHAGEQRAGELRGQAALRRFRGETDARAGTLRAGTSLLDGVSRVARI